MDMGFAVIGPLARCRMPVIGFLFIASRFLLHASFQTPPRDDALALRYDFTSIRLSIELSNMLGTHQKGAR